MKPLTIALSKGRLLAPALSLFEKIGLIALPDRGRQLVFDSTDGRCQFLLVKPVDVPTYVEQGAADIGIVGGDVLLESDSDVLCPLMLGYGACRIVVAAPRGDAITASGRPRRIATKYPRIAERFFSEQRIPAAMIRLGGSVELAPSMGLSDWIVDLVETGRTLVENGLEPIAEITTTQAQLIVNRASQKLRREGIGLIIEQLSKELPC
jgi:ATP phosphoribosyltransferase